MKFCVIYSQLVVRMSFDDMGRIGVSTCYIVTIIASWLYFTCYTLQAKCYMIRLETWMKSFDLMAQALPQLVTPHKRYPPDACCNEELQSNWSNWDKSVKQICEIFWWEDMINSLNQFSSASQKYSFGLYLAVFLSGQEGCVWFSSQTGWCFFWFPYVTV